jgi:hypothetical protein
MLKFMPRSKKQKARLARSFTIISATALLLIFIVRDVFRENLKDVHDSVAQAETLYRIHYGQNDINLRSEGETFNTLQNYQYLQQFKNPPPAPDIAELRNRAGESLNEAQDELYLVSELIDALPSSATTAGPTQPDIRKLRDEHRVRIEREKGSWAAFQPDDGTDSEVRQRMAFHVYETVYGEHQELIWLGVLSVRAAKHALQVMERRIRICSYVIYILGSVVLLLGVCAAVINLKLESEGV